MTTAATLAFYAALRFGAIAFVLLAIFVAALLYATRNDSGTN